MKLLLEEVMEEETLKRLFPDYLNDQEKTELSYLLSIDTTNLPLKKELTKNIVNKLKLFIKNNIISIHERSEEITKNRASILKEIADSIKGDLKEGSEKQLNEKIKYIVLRKNHTPVKKNGLLEITSDFINYFANAYDDLLPGYKYLTLEQKDDICFLRDCSDKVMPEKKFTKLVTEKFKVYIQSYLKNHVPNDEGDDKKQEVFNHRVSVLCKVATSIKNEENSGSEEELKETMRTIFSDEEKTINTINTVNGFYRHFDWTLYSLREDLNNLKEEVITAEPVVASMDKRPSPEKRDPNIDRGSPNFSEVSPQNEAGELKKTIELLNQARQEKQTLSNNLESLQNEVRREKQKRDALLIDLTNMTNTKNALLRDKENLSGEVCELEENLRTVTEERNALLKAKKEQEELMYEAAILVEDVDSDSDTLCKMANTQILEIDRLTKRVAELETLVAKGGALAVAPREQYGNRGPRMF